MRHDITSRIVARTTLNLADPVLAELKRLQLREGRPLGELASELLARALAERRAGREEPARLVWTARSMGARIDLGDKEALYAALDRPLEQVAEGE